MNNILDNRDIILFLGAGFSVDSCLPVIGDFGSHCKQEHEKLKNHADPCGKYKNAGPMLNESFKVFEQFQRYCRTSKIMSEDDIDNMEQIFTIAEVLRESGIAEIKLDKTMYQIQELIAHIQLTLWKVYQKCPLISKQLEISTPIKDIYRPFFEELRGHIGKVTIITTNYDLIIESMFLDLGYRCIYPILNNGHKRSIIVGQRTLEDVKNNNSRYVEYLYKVEESGQTGDFKIVTNDEYRNSPILCKLHGSINYFYDTREEIGKQIYVADDLGNGEHIGKSGSWNNRPSILALDAIWNLHNKYGRSLAPAIIPPTYSKLTGHNWLREIWHVAFRALAKAKRILFIGYSFTETDGFMRAMLQGAMAMREAEDFPEIYLIDKSKETICRYKKLFKSELTKVFEMEFSKAVSNGVIKECLGSQSQS